LSPEELHSDADLSLIDAFTHDALVPFVVEEWQRPSRILRGYRFGQLIYLAVLMFHFWRALAAESLSWADALGWFLGGSLLALPLLVALHEGLHALAYRLLGARKLALGGNWRKAYFYIAAHRFVLDKKRFGWVALAPLVIIGGVLVAALFWVEGPVHWLLLGVLGWHVLSCAGDMALVSFSMRYEKFYTYDDLEHAITYFFGVNGTSPDVRK